jgi:AraC-like DNA-binding protein
MISTEMESKFKLVAAGLRGLANLASTQGDVKVELVADDMHSMFRGIRSEFERLRQENGQLRKGRLGSDRFKGPASVDLGACLEIEGLQVHQGLGRWAQDSGLCSRNEIEIGLVEAGQMTWHFNGQPQNVQAGTLYAFWAIRHHQVGEVAAGTVVHSLSIPLHSFVAWMMPGRLSKTLLGGAFILEVGGQDLFADGATFATWSEELKSDDPDRRRAVLREMEARLYRLASHLWPQNEGEVPATALEAPVKWAHLEKVARIAEHVSLHFKEPLSVPDIAKAVGLQSTTATKLFKRSCGINLVQYLIQQRLSYARQLLSYSGLKVPEIVAASGYGSVSRFYASHKKLYGMTPMEFRARELGRKKNLRRGREGDSGPQAISKTTRN